MFSKFFKFPLKLCSLPKGIAWPLFLFLLIVFLAPTGMLGGCGGSSRPRPEQDAHVESDAVLLGDAQPWDGMAVDATNETDGSESPWVEITSPLDGAFVENPVTFEIATYNVTTVELFVDDWPLGPAWDPSATNTFTYDFSGTGFQREVKLVGYDASSNVLADHTIHITVETGDIGEYHGTMWNTYYYIAHEDDYSGPDDTTLYDVDCNPMASVPAAYSDAVCIEGSGILSDGRVINYATTCSCGRPCPTGGTVCYFELDSVQYPWGMGSFSNALEPFRSWAVDNDYIAPGTKIYAEEWDGVEIPFVDGIGGFIHDGCFRADDVGGWIEGNHFDFFAGTYNMYLELESIFPTNSYFEVYLNPGKCP